MATPLRLLPKTYRTSLLAHTNLEPCSEGNPEQCCSSLTELTQETFTKSMSTLWCQDASATVSNDFCFHSYSNSLYLPMPQISGNIIGGFDHWLLQNFDQVSMHIRTKS